MCSCVRAWSLFSGEILITFPLTFLIPVSPHRSHDRDRDWRIPVLSRSLYHEAYRLRDRSPPVTSITGTPQSPFHQPVIVSTCTPPEDLRVFSLVDRSQTLKNIPGCSPCGQASSEQGPETRTAPAGPAFPFILIPAGKHGHEPMKASCRRPEPLDPRHYERSGCGTPGQVPENHSRPPPVPREAMRQEPPP